MGKSRKDYEKFLNSISPDRDDEAWIIGGKNRYCGRERTKLHSLYYCEAEFLSRLVTVKYKRYE